jgi:hypothetical protein
LRFERLLSSKGSFGPGTGCAIGTGLGVDRAGRAGRAGPGDGKPGVVIGPSRFGIGFGLGPDIGPTCGFFMASGFPIGMGGFAAPGPEPNGPGPVILEAMPFPIGLGGGCIGLVIGLGTAGLGGGCMKLGGA